MDNYESQRFEVVGFKTEDGYTFLFNSQGELTDGDMVYESSDSLLASVDATPIKLTRNSLTYYYH